MKPQRGLFLPRVEWPQGTVIWCRASEGSKFRGTSNDPQPHDLEESYEPWTLWAGSGPTAIPTDHVGAIASLSVFLSCPHPEFPASAPPQPMTLHPVHRALWLHGKSDLSLLCPAPFPGSLVPPRPLPPQQPLLLSPACPSCLCPEHSLWPMCPVDIQLSVRECGQQLGRLCCLKVRPWESHIPSRTLSSLLCKGWL